MQYTVSPQWFADKVESLVEHLLPHRAFLSRLLQTGGTLTLIVQFLGDGYFGDKIPQSTLAKIADLGLSLGRNAVRHCGRARTLGQPAEIYTHCSLRTASTAARNRASDPRGQSTK